MRSNLLDGFKWIKYNTNKNRFNLLPRGSANNKSPKSHTIKLKHIKKISPITNKNTNHAHAFTNTVGFLQMMVFAITNIKSVNADGNNNKNKS